MGVLDRYFFFFFLFLSFMCHASFLASWFVFHVSLIYFSLRALGRSRHPRCQERHPWRIAFAGLAPPERFSDRVLHILEAPESYKKTCFFDLRPKHYKSENQSTLGRSRFDFHPPHPSWVVSVLELGGIDRKSLDLARASQPHSPGITKNQPQGEQGLIPQFIRHQISTSSFYVWCQLDPLGDQFWYLFQLLGIYFSLIGPALIVHQLWDRFGFKEKVAHSTPDFSGHLSS